MLSGFAAQCQLQRFVWLGVPTAGVHRLALPCPRQTRSGGDRFAGEVRDPPALMCWFFCGRCSRDVVEVEVGGCDDNGARCVCTVSCVGWFRRRALDACSPVNVPIQVLWADVVSGTIGYSATSTVSSSAIGS